MSIPTLMVSTLHTSCALVGPGLAQSHPTELRQIAQVAFPQVTPCQQARNLREDQRRLRQQRRVVEEDIQSLKNGSGAGNATPDVDGPRSSDLRERLAKLEQLDQRNDEIERAARAAEENCRYQEEEPESSAS